MEFPFSSAHRAVLFQLGNLTSGYGAYAEVGVGPVQVKDQLLKLDLGTVRKLMADLVGAGLVDNDSQGFLTELGKGFYEGTASDDDERTVINHLCSIRSAEEPVTDNPGEADTATG